MVLGIQILARTSNAMPDWNKPCMRPDDIMSIGHVLKVQTKNSSNSDQAIQLSRSFCKTTIKSLDKIGVSKTLVRDWLGLTVRVQTEGLDAALARLPGQSPCQSR